MVIDQQERDNRREYPRISVLGVRIDNLTRRQVIELIEEAIRRQSGTLTKIFIVNAHTLNLAAADSTYRDTLNSGGLVLADGTGVRWAAKLRGVRIAENMVGTDLVPLLFQTTANRDYSYFLLGSDATTIGLAADYAGREFPGWKQAGHHHGYMSEDSVAATIEAINAARPDLLLVGMGNPIQEKWIARYASQLKVPVCMGIGGLFDYWAGNVSRAPAWLRRMGHEWIWRLFQQPRLKAHRYLMGNPAFLWRVLRDGQSS